MSYVRGRLANDSKRGAQHGAELYVIESNYGQLLRNLNISGRERQQNFDRCDFIHRHDL